MSKVIDINKPVETHRGTPIIILSDKGPGGYPLVGHVEGAWDLHQWTRSGKPKDRLYVPPIRNKVEQR